MEVCRATFRRKRSKIIDRKVVIFTFLFGFCFFSIIGLIGYRSDGFMSRYKGTVIGEILTLKENSRRQNNQACKKSDMFPFCIIGNDREVRTALIGDSHSVHLYAALAETTLTKTEGILGLKGAACPPSVNAYVASNTSFEL